jgi:hydroxycarboxylate dehydrogenase B
MSTPTVLRSAAALEIFAAQLIAGMGADPEVAAETGRHLLGANLAGHDSHGILRIPRYAKLAERGLLAPSARPTIIRQRGATALVDAHLGLGQFSTRFALDHALELAATYGSATVAIRHSTHIGRLGEYAELAAARGMIALVTMGIAGPGQGGVVPFGGSGRFVSTNPWCIGAPAGDDGPFLYDAATSSIAEGKIHYAHASGKALPQGTVVDATGRPTTATRDFYAGGALLPVGGLDFGHKGYGFALAAAMLGGLAMIDDPHPSLPTAAVEAHPGRAPGMTSGVLVMVIDPSAFGPAGAYAEMTGATLGAVRAEPPAPGHTRVLAPGDPEREARAARLQAGIAIPEATWTELCATAQDYGITPP